MNLILTRLLSGSILCCLCFNYPALAKSIYDRQSKPVKPIFLSAKALSYQPYSVSPVNLNFNYHIFDYSLSINRTKYLDKNKNIDNWFTNNNGLSSNSIISNSQPLSLEKIIYKNHQPRADLTLGFHDTFWQSKNSSKYWGLTAVKTWGNQAKNPNSIQSNHFVPFLPKGTTFLTMSGGGNRNLVEKTNILGEFSDFRGGIALQQGLSQNVSVGVGFVYDNLLLGFSQISYQPSNLPLQTSISLVTGKQGTELHSHLNFKPTENLAINFYSDRNDKKFALQWGITPGLSLIAKANSKQGSFSAGIKSKNFLLNYYTDREKQTFDLQWEIISGLSLIAHGNSQKNSLATAIKFKLQKDRFTLNAIAGFNNKNVWQWKIDSQIGNLKLALVNNDFKNSANLSYDVLTLPNPNLTFSLFANYENREVKNKDESLTVSGWQVASNEQFGNHQHRWQFNFGYGVGSQGKGVVASAGAAVSSDLFLKLSVEEVSLVSDRLNFKLELSK